jgi:predicted transcriptional regulator
MARKKSSEQLTPLELELMKVLWEEREATVQQVLDRMPEERDLAYTTVQTMLNVLHRKQRVERTLRDRAYCYKPVVSRQKAMGQIVGDLVDRVFGGSAESLVMNLLETRRLTPDKLAKLREKIDSAGGSRDRND